MAAEIKHRHYMNFDIAGFTYWDGALVLCDLKPGKKVRLESVRVCEAYESTIGPCIPSPWGKWGQVQNYVFANVTFRKTPVIDNRKRKAVYVCMAFTLFWRASSWMAHQAMGYNP